MEKFKHITIPSHVVDIIVEYVFFWKIARDRARLIKMAKLLVSVGRPGYTRPFHKDIVEKHNYRLLLRDMIEDENYNF